MSTSGVEIVSKRVKTAPMPRPLKNTDRKAPTRTTVDEELVGPAQKLMKRLRLKHLTVLVNMALREKLEREGEWPVAQEKNAQTS